MKIFQKNVEIKQGKYVDRGFITNFFINRHLITLTQIIQTVQSSKIFDAGCGEGIPLLYLYNNINSKDIFGVDCDKEKIIMIKNNIPRGIFMVGSIYSIPFDSKKFDLTLCLEVLEHLEYPQKALHEIRRVSNGTVLFSVPNEPIWSILNMFRFKYISRLGNTPDHQHQWTKASFCKLLKNNFTIIKTTVRLPWTFVLCSPID